MSRERKPSLVPPWSDKGWYGEDSRRRLSPEVRELIDREGHGKWNPVLYYEGRSALAWSPAFHNPYSASVVGIGFGVLGVFVFIQMQDVLWAALLAGGIFVIASLVITILNVRRIPSWHRARRSVRAHVSEHGGLFPRELRWYA